MEKKRLAVPEDTALYGNKKVAGGPLYLTTILKLQKNFLFSELFFKIVKTFLGPNLQKQVPVAA